jgi:hypothetical protein
MPLNQGMASALLPLGGGGLGAGLGSDEEQPATVTGTSMPALQWLQGRAGKNGVGPLVWLPTATARRAVARCTEARDGGWQLGRPFPSGQGHTGRHHGRLGSG